MVSPPLLKAPKKTPTYRYLTQDLATPELKSYMGIFCRGMHASDLLSSLAEAVPCFTPNLRNVWTSRGVFTLRSPECVHVQ